MYVVNESVIDKLDSAGHSPKKYYLYVIFTLQYMP
jgi:hypothetical protein